jgi:hypothetical protein
MTPCSKRCSSAWAISSKASPLKYQNVSNWQYMIYHDIRMISIIDKYH